MNLSKRNLYIIGGVAAVVIFFILLLIILPQWQSSAYRAKFTDVEIQKLTPQEKIQYERNVADIEDKTRLTLAQIIGGLALLSGLYFTYKNIRVNEEGKLTDRFSKAVELLGSEKLDVRLGGIYALERIARDSQKDHWTVMEVLTAFVRENAPYVPNQEETSADQETFKLREDIQAIMTVIGRRKWTDSEKEKLDLRQVHLRGCNLREANLNRIDFSGADLSRTFLVKAILRRANLMNADLSQARLLDADLSKALLIGTNLIDANFLTIKQLSSSVAFRSAKLSPQLEKQRNEWYAKQLEEKAGAGEDSSEDQAEK